VCVSCVFSRAWIRACRSEL